MTFPLADWFNDRPLSLHTVCTRLIEAVEEREKYFLLPADGYYPLALPEKPYFCSDMYGEYLKDQSVWFIRDFAKNLYHRVSILLRNSFIHDNFGKWSAIFPLNNFSAVQAYLKSKNADLDAFLSDGGITGKIRPHCFENMRFFYAVADILNRCVRYPSPPYFDMAGKQKNGYVFGMDCLFELHDELTGTTHSGEYQPDGLRFTMATEVVAPNTQWQAGYRAGVDDNDEFTFKYHYRARKSRPFYKIDSGQNADWNSYDSYTRPIPLHGSFKAKMQMTISLCHAGGVSRRSEETILTIRPDGESDEVDFSRYQEDFAKCTLSSSPDGRGESYASAHFLCNEVMLDAANYPPLPYKYLT